MKHYMFLFIFCCVSYATLNAQIPDTLHNADATFDELEPVYFSVKNDGITFKVINYFSNKILFTSRGVYPVEYYDSVSNYGVTLNTDKKSNKLFVKNVRHLMHETMITYEDSIQYFVLVQSLDGVITQHHLTIKQRKIAPYQSKNNKAFEQHNMWDIMFEPLEIAINSTEKVYLMCKDLAKYNFFNLSFVTSKKKFTYTYENGKIIPLDVQRLTSLERLGFASLYKNKNKVWQAKITYYDYE